MNPVKISVLRNRLEANGFKIQGGQLRGNCPWRPDSDSGAFVVNLGDNGVIGWFDHVTEQSGKLSDLARHYGIADFDAPEPELNGSTSNNPEYIYQNIEGQPVYKVIRKPDKNFLQMHFCPETKAWAWGLGGNKKKCGCRKISMIPYCLPELAAAPGAPVIVCEGEKDVHTARRLGFIATCNSGGAGKWGHLPKSVYRYFENKPVIIIADNDDAGRHHANEVARSLWPYAGSIKIIQFDGPKGYDLTDWAKDGQRNGADLLDTISKAEPYQQKMLPLDENPLASQPPDDEGHAQCVHYLYGGQFLCTDELGWLQYTGSYWKSKGAEAALNRAIVDVLIQRRVLAVQNGDEKLIKASKPTANNVKNAKFMFGSIVWASIDDFDNNPDLLNCDNGVVNLTAGNLAPHEHGQRFTYCIDTPYDPQADDSLWADWLYNTVTPAGCDNDGRYADLAAWLQMAAGYSLTGHTHEQCLFYLQGPPRAGKGVFLQTLDKLLGRPLSSGVDFDTFTDRRGGDSQNFDLAPLKACRLITASESKRTTMLNAKRVKSITGNDPVYCAHKRKDFFSYIPQYKIWLSSNFKVMAQADDDALWSRLRIINFPNSHLGKEDFGLEARLWEARTGILKWAIDGAKSWYQRKATNIGLGHPEIITNAVQSHRNENDTVAQFIEDCCIVGPDQYAAGAQLTIAYKDWCNENSLPPLGGRRLGEALRHKGYTYKAKLISGKTKKCWLGIGLEI